MFNGSETSIIFFITLIALGVLLWGYRRAASYGKLGILAWLQSVTLTLPWLIFFGLFALGIHLNLVAIIFLMLTSVAVYIALGKKLRAEGQAELLQQKAAEKIKLEEEKAENRETLPENLSEQEVKPEIVPIPPADLELIKGIFGIDTFWQTEAIPYEEGAIFRGNLRAEPDKAYEKLKNNLKSVLGDKYRLFLVESPEEKPVVIILPAKNDPQPATLAQKNLAIVLFLATIATTLEAAALLRGFDLFSELNRYREVIPLALGIWAVLIAHELGHRWLANKYEVRLSIPFFLPSWQIGSFGAITRFESLLPNRTALFDIAIAGPASGGIVSLLMLIGGLILSHPGSTFQIPSEFFHGSILVGGLAKVILGDKLQAALVDVHPLTIIGWLGLVITCLNLLPAGQLDGGRIVQAIYGRKTARRSTIATLIILGIVALFNPANPIPLYWALLILFLQRDLERPSLNELSEVNDSRAFWGLIILFLMLITLIPLSADLAIRLGIGVA